MRLKPTLSVTFLFMILKKNVAEGFMNLHQTGVLCAAHSSYHPPGREGGQKLAGRK
jgi:hypothetical protein